MRTPIADAIRTEFRQHGDEVFINRVQDCEPALEAAKARHNGGFFGFGKGSDDYRHAASVPAVLIEKYCQLRGVSYAEFMRSDDHIRAFLNDPDHAHLRIWKGRI